MTPLIVKGSRMEDQQIILEVAVPITEVLGLAGLPVEGTSVRLNGEVLSSRDYSETRAGNGDVVETAQKAEQG